MHNLEVSIWIWLLHGGLAGSPSVTSPGAAGFGQQGASFEKTPLITLIEAAAYIFQEMPPQGPLAYILPPATCLQPAGAGLRPPSWGGTQCPRWPWGGHSVSGRPCPAHAYNRQGRDGTTSGNLGDLSFTHYVEQKKPPQTSAPTWPSQPSLCKEQAVAELKG